MFCCEEQFLAQFRNTVCNISFPMQMSVFTDEAEIVVPKCIMQSNLCATVIEVLVLKCYKQGFPLSNRPGY